MALTSIKGYVAPATDPIFFVYDAPTDPEGDEEDVNDDDEEDVNDDDDNEEVCSGTNCSGYRGS